LKIGKIKSAVRFGPGLFATVLNRFQVQTTATAICYRPPVCHTAYHFQSRPHAPIAPRPYLSSYRRCKAKCFSTHREALLVAVSIRHHASFAPSLTVHPCHHYCTESHPWVPPPSCCQPGRPQAATPQDLKPVLVAPSAATSFSAPDTSNRPPI
jgi:hypothetical protein